MNDNQIDTNVKGCLGLVIGFMMLGFILILFFPGEKIPIDSRLKLYNISGHRILIYVSYDTLLTNARIYNKAQSYKDSYNSEYRENGNDYLMPYSNTELVSMEDWIEKLNRKKDKTIYYYLFDVDSIINVKNNGILDSSIYNRVVLERIDITERLIKEKYWILKYKEIK